MLFLPYSSYYTPELASVKNAFFLRVIRLSNTPLKQGYRLLESYMVDKKILSNITKFLPLECHMTLESTIIYSDTLQSSDISLKCYLVTKLDIVTEFNLLLSS